MKKYTIDKLDSFLYSNNIIPEILSKEKIDELYLEWKENNGVNFHDYLWNLYNEALTRNPTDNLEMFYLRQSSLYFKWVFLGLMKMKTK